MASLFARAIAGLGRALQPLLNPDGPWLRDRMETIVSGQRRATKLVERQQKQIGGFRDDVEALKTKSNTDIRSIRGAVHGLDSRVRRQLSFSERVIKRAADDTQSWRFEKVLVRLEKLARGTAPILVGPWTGEVGFELVYWMPFVRWVVAHYEIDPARLIICSRGGPESWYHGICGRYVDVFSVSEASEFRLQTEATPKQRTLRSFDRAILRRARAKLDAGPMSLLHPALMYHLFMPYWKREAPLMRVLDHARFTRLQPFTAPEVEGRLPDRYVAVRFYFSQCFPDTPSNRAFVGQALLSLSEEMDVVILNPGIKVDDHDDVLIPRVPRIHVLDAVMRPERNLNVQSSVISRAAAFVGTYGGFSYLAPFFGVPSLAFYSDRNFYLPHLHTALYALAAAEGATLTVIDTADAAMIRLATR